MALQSSGAISLNNVNVELGNSGSANINMNSTAVRTLLERPTGSISMSHAYGKSDAAELTYNASYQDTVNRWPYTFSGVNIGAAASDRFVIICCTSDRQAAGQNTSSCTIGGVGATRLISTAGNNGWHHYTMWGATVTSGTTATVTLNQSQASNNMVISSYSAYNLSSTTPTQTKTDLAFSGYTLSTSVSIPGGGFAISTACGGTSSVVSWSWSAGATEDDDRYPETLYCGRSSAHSTTDGTTAMTATANKNLAGYGMMTIVMK